MGKHSVPSRRRRLVHVASASAAVIAVTTGVVPAHADEIGDLIDRLSAVSDEATAKSEEIKKIEGEIAKGEKDVAALRQAAQDARREAEQAVEARSGAQVGVDDHARAQYRNLASDARINDLESANPQEAIDRAAYLGSLSRSAQRSLDESHRLSQMAAQRATDANIAVAVANYRQVELEGKREQLEQERRDLDRQVKEVEERVNAFTPEERARWEAKNGPVALNVPPSAYGNGVVAAALAKIGSPYGWGSAGPSAFDCSGLMFWSYAQNGKSIPRTSQAQLAGGTRVSLSELQPGDIVGYYPGVTHVAMYIGNGQVVHASDYGIPVQVVPLNSMPIQGAVRY